MFDYTKPEPDGQGMWKIEEMMKCFLAPAFLLLGGHSLTLRTSAANAIMLLKHHPEFKIQSPVSQDNIVVPYKLIDSAPLMVTWVTPEEVVRTGGGRLLTTKPLMRPLPPH